MMQNLCRKPIRGFTLAEVLIVLSIIGVVAAMTIPTLVNNSQKGAYVAALKEDFSLFQNGFRTYMATQGCTDLVCLNLFNGGQARWDTNTAKKNILSQIFKIAKHCDYYECQKTVKYVNVQSSSDVDYDFGLGSGTVYAGILANGTLFSIWQAGDNCAMPTTPTGSKLDGLCAEIYMDVNGSKGPDQYGRDVYIFYLARTGYLYPWGGEEDRKLNSWLSHWDDSSAYYSCLPGSSDESTGWDCAARLQEKSWSMDY